MQEGKYLRFLLAFTSALGLVALGDFYSHSAMQRDAVLFGQSLGKLLVGGAFSIPLIGSLFVCIYFHRLVAYADHKLPAISSSRPVSLALKTARLLYIIALASTSTSALLAFAGARILQGSSNPIHISLLQTRFLVLWFDILLLVLLAVVSLGLSRTSRAALLGTLKIGRQPTLKKVSWKEGLLVASVAVLTVVAVYQRAWVSEDSFITFRYVSNSLSGYGPVFNAGERVQGYTHPLWFALLVLGSILSPNPIYLSIVYGLFFTLLTVGILGHTLSRLAGNRASLVTIIVLASLASIVSDPWLSFQTSGLENSLSNLLIAGILIETWVYPLTRPGWVALLVCLLCLNRPDFLLFAAPIALLLPSRIRDVRALARLVGAALPASAWILFAWGYYGSPLPNTVFAKLGIYPNWIETIEQGLLYIEDWFIYDTVAAGSAILFLGVAVFSSTSKERIACVVGLVLYVAWVIWIGGDFMRGRLFTPILTASIVLGSLALAETSALLKGRMPPVGAGIVACFILALFAIQRSVPDPRTSILGSGIVNERLYYPGYQLKFLLEQGRLENPYIDLDFAQQLRRYAQECGHLTIHLRNPGTIGYLAGPEVTIIDTLGLTDAYVARLPRQYLITAHPRPGHPDKDIPMSYLVSRQDVAVLPDWRDSVSRGDCSLSERLATLQYSPDALFRPE